MKKILLSLAALMAIPSSASAIDLGGIYVKAYGGYGKLQNNSRQTKYNAIFNATEGQAVDVKLGTKNNGFMGVGAGLNVTEDFSVDISYEHFFNKDIKGGRNFAVTNVVDADVKEKHDAKIDNLMLNFAFNMYDFGPAKLFLGTGVGLAQINERVRLSGSADTFARQGRTIVQTGSDVDLTETLKRKKKNGFAYSASAGIRFNVISNVSLELGYTWKDMGTSSYGTIYRGSYGFGGIKIGL